MPQEPFELGQVLDFRPDLGIIRLHKQRVVILSAAAMGLIRKELIDTVGAEIARRVMLRFGYADGYHDAVSLFREAECAAQGHERCVLTGRDAASWDDELEALRSDYQGATLEREVEHIRDAVHREMQALSAASGTWHGANAS